MKRVWKILIGVAVVLVVILIAVVLSINVIAKAGIEKGASMALGVKASVDSVSISFLGGSAEVKGLNIGNPEGYGDGNLLELGRAYIKLKPASIFSKVIEVAEVTVEKPVLKLRQQGLKTNLSAFLDKINALSGPSGGAAGSPPSKGKGYKVGVINLNDARMEYSIGGAPAVPVPLPSIAIKDIGSENGNVATLGSIIKQVIVEMAQAAAKSGSKLVPAGLSDSLNGTLKGVGGGLKKTATGVEGAVKGIGGLFKGAGSQNK